ncbi:MAG: hypothetical protein JSU81_00615 [Candidatus Coatesbacteria bacterium]|nr:MAG: hypothetical protein JSU81_00615 [Candidatus Coatesbacteria bacterium]
MKKISLIAAVAGAFLGGYLLGCGDEIYGSDIQRYVYEVSEANVTAAGGKITVPVLHVGQEGEGGGDMGIVAVYGSGRGRNNRWQILLNVDLREGEVWVDPNEGGGNYFYRVVVIY